MFKIFPIQHVFNFLFYTDRVCIVCSCVSTFVISVLIHVSSPDFEAVCTFFGLYVVSAFPVLLGVMFSFNCFSCCISFLSCSICFSFEVNVWLIFEVPQMVFCHIFVAFSLGFVLMTSLELSVVHLPHWCYWCCVRWRSYCILHCLHPIRHLYKIF